MSAPDPSRVDNPDLVAKLLDAVAGSGISRILADELKTGELIAFERALKQFESSLDATDKGFAGFIRTICEHVRVDPRLDDAGRSS